MFLRKNIAMSKLVPKKLYLDGGGGPIELIVQGALGTFRLDKTKTGNQTWSLQALSCEAHLDVQKASWTSRGASLAVQRAFCTSMGAGLNV